MKKLILPSIGLLMSFLTAQAQYFSPTNLVLVQQNTVSNDGAAVTIVQMQTNGTQVSSTNLPSSGTSAFILGTSVTEGFESISANSNLLVLAGYNATPPTASAPGSSLASTVPRAVATLDAYDNYALPISNTKIYSLSTIRGAASDGLGNFWVSGGGGFNGTTNNGEIGIVYVGTASQPTNVSVSETGTGIEQCLDTFNGNLYVSTGFTTHGIFMISNVSGAYPTVEGSLYNNTNVIPMSSSSSPYDFQINSASTIAYVADASLGGIVKFTSTGPGGVWTSNYTLSVLTAGIAASSTTTNAYGCAVDWSQITPVIYATTAETPQNRLVRIADTGASALGAAIATAPANTVWRGVRFGPEAYPLIASQTPSLLTDNGQNVAFSVNALGTPPFTYQWYSNNNVSSPSFAAIPGATGSTLSLNDVTPGQSNTTYYVIVANAYGTAQSTNAILTVDPPGPPINLAVTPASQTVNAEGTAVFNGSFVGSTTNLSYGWTHNGTNLQDGSLGPSTISGSATPTLTITNAFAIDDGSYAFIVTNNFGHASGGLGVLQVNDPLVVSNAVGATNFPGNGSVELSVTAVGTGLSYQWLSNGVAISGATTSSYSAPNQSSAIATSYSVVVTSTDGSSVTNGPTIVDFTDLLLDDDFNYPNGPLVGAPGSPWALINESGSYSVNLVTDHQVQVAAADATTDVQSLFSTNILAEIGLSNTPPGNDGVYWVSFTVNVSTLPSNPGGVYFANLEDKDYNFWGRIFCLTSNNDNEYNSTPPGNMPNVAFPGTYRLGISDYQGDFDPENPSSTGPTAIVPMDLAPGIDYTVVYAVDYINLYSRMAVNPASSNDVLAILTGGVGSGAADDSFPQTTSTPLGAGFRQRGGEGVLYVGNLKVATEVFAADGSASYLGYGYVTEGITATNPVIGLQPVGVTNYSKNPYTMEVAASGIGAPGVGLSYAWYRNSSPLSDGADVTGSTNYTLTLNSLGSIDDGTYYVIVTGAAGSTQSSNALVSVNTALTPPSFTLPGGIEPPANTTSFQGDTVAFTAVAVGTGPMTYQWYFNNGTGAVPANSTTSTLTLSATTNDSGTYYVVATGGDGTGTSSNAVLTVSGPQIATIGYLRSLFDPATYEPANETDFYEITGVVTTATNLTTGNTLSCYIQDATGGINLFVTYGSSFRPQLGDVVTAIGTLSSYTDNYELDVTEGEPGYTNYIVSHGSPQPTPILLPWGYTPPLPANIASNVEGSVVMLTDLWFEAYSPGAVFAQDNYVVTNNAGLSYMVHVSDQDTNFVVGQPMPQFAYSIAGPLITDSGSSIPIGIEFTVYSNLVTNASLPPVTITNLAGSITGGGADFTLTWTAGPNTASYSVLHATNVMGPWTNKLATGLTFTNTQGSYSTALLKSSPANFYDVSSP